MVLLEFFLMLQTGGTFSKTCHFFENVPLDWCRTVGLGSLRPGTHRHVICFQKFSILWNLERLIVMVLLTSQIEISNFEIWFSRLLLIFTLRFMVAHNQEMFLHRYSVCLFQFTPYYRILEKVVLLTSQQHQFKFQNQISTRRRSNFKNLTSGTWSLTSNWPD